ncbi:deaminase [Nocardia tengchongensis]|uniref:deaminase n=1 Tax=Nocardia tengchongensis TaxID=2055889 RepID=UPI0036AB1463
MDHRPDSHSYNDIERGFAVRAIEEARRSSGNARVGAVITRGDSILSTGHKGEGLHAEQAALQKARDVGTDLAGATLYTTLEPCTNPRTSRVPCAQLIADAGIAVVHIGEFDPNPRIYRLGWKYLRDSGIQLRDFPADLREQAHDVNTTSRACSRGERA